MLRWMRRIIFTLMLTVAAAILFVWFRSYTTGDRYRWAELRDEGNFVELRVTTIAIGEGGIALSIDRRQAHTDDGIGRVRLTFARRFQSGLGYGRISQPSYPANDTIDPGAIQILGAGYSHRARTVNNVTREMRGIVIPLWMLLAVVTVYPLGIYLLRLVRREREERILLGLCPRCAVDVRSDPARCPGCDLQYPLRNSETANSPRSSIQSMSWQRV